MKLHQRLWMIPAAYYAGLVAIAAGLGLVASGRASAFWLAAWLAGHLAGALLLSVGLHRYFSHGAFKTSPFWHGAMAVGSILLFQGSPQGWAAAHSTHHVHSDTERDPHYANMAYLWNKRYRDVPMVRWRLRMLADDRTLKFVHRNALAIAAGFSVMILLLSWKLYLFGYLMALGSSHFIGAVHQITSHRGGAPRDLPALEWIFPACGEWRHRFHHRFPSEWQFGTRWWHLDMGAWVIRAIKT